MISGTKLPYPLKIVTKPHFSKYIESCNTDHDCKLPNQYCTNFLWVGSEDGKSFAYGSCCYTWGKSVCPAS